MLNQGRTVSLLFIQRIGPNLYMAAEVKRKYYPLRIGSKFFLLPFIANRHTALTTDLAIWLLLSTVSVRRITRAGKNLTARGLHQTSIESDRIAQMIFDKQLAALGQL